MRARAPTGTPSGAGKRLPRAPGAGVRSRRGAGPRQSRHCRRPWLRRCSPASPATRRRPSTRAGEWSMRSMRKASATRRSSAGAGAARPSKETSRSSSRRRRRSVKSTLATTRRTLVARHSPRQGPQGRRRKARARAAGGPAEPRVRFTRRAEVGGAQSGPRGPRVRVKAAWGGEGPPAWSLETRPGCPSYPACLDATLGCRRPFPPRLTHRRRFNYAR